MWQELTAGPPLALYHGRGAAHDAAAGRATHDERTGAAHRAFDAVIVGAGLRRAVHAPPPARARALRRGVLEAGDGVGGTWYWNRYPGARCDVESMDYSYSFSDELAAGVALDASATPPSPRSCATSTTSPTASTCAATSSFETRVTAAHVRRGDRAAGRSTTDRGERVAARFCIMATGCLSTPQRARLPGPRRLRGRRRTTPAAGRTRASTSPASASA